MAETADREGIGEIKKYRGLTVMENHSPALFISNL